MSNEDQNLEVVGAIYAAMAESNISALFDLIDPACVMTQDDRLPWGGRHVGHDGFADFALRLRQHIQSSVITTALFAADGDVIQVGRTVGTTVEGETPFEIDEVHRWTILDGRAVAAHFSIDTPMMLHALRSQDPVGGTGPF